MRRIFLLLLISLYATLTATAITSKRLTAIVPKLGLTKESYQALENESRDFGAVIKSNWFPSEYNQNLRTVIKLKNNQTGLPRYEISENSGAYDFDASCLKAIERSFATMSFTNNTEVEYLFEYKNTKVNFPVAKVFTWPMQIGMGYLGKKLGLTSYVQIPIY